MPQITFDVGDSPNGDVQINKDPAIGGAPSPSNLSLFIGMLVGKGTDRFLGCARFDVDIPQGSTINGVSFNFRVKAVFDDTALMSGRWSWGLPDTDWNVAGTWLNYAQMADIPSPYRGTDNVVDLTLVQDETVFEAPLITFAADTDYSAGDGLVVDVELPGFAQNLENYLTENEALRDQDGAVGIPCDLIIDFVDFTPVASRSYSIFAENDPTPGFRPTLTVDYSDSSVPIRIEQAWRVRHCRHRRYDRTVRRAGSNDGAIPGYQPGLNTTRAQNFVEKEATRIGFGTDEELFDEICDSPEGDTFEEVIEADDPGDL